MSRRTSLIQRLVIGSLVAALAAPHAALAAAGALGTARGLRGVEVSIDGGATWVRLQGRTLPLVSGARFRSTTGVATLDLGPRGRLTLLPFSAVEVGAGPAAEVAVRYGRVEWRQPAGRAGAPGGLEVTTADARLRAAAGAPLVADVFVAEGVTGVRVRSGAVEAATEGGARRTARAGSALFLPAAPAGAEAVFGSEAQRLAPARAVFSAQGENIGYVRTDGQLVVQPGFAKDLSRAFPASLVQRAVAQVPEGARDRAVPLLDLSGQYVGYVDGPVFHAAAQPVAPDGSRATVAGETTLVAGAAPAGGSAQPSTSGAGVASWPWHYTLGFLGVVGGIGAIAAGVADDDDDPATPTTP